jgi:hypothetical protein
MGAAFMDLNYFYHRRGKTLIMAALATCVRQAVKRAKLSTKPLGIRSS